MKTLVTLVYQDAHNHELVRVHTGEFLESDPEFVQCALDAAWTAFKEKRHDQGVRLLGEVIAPSRVAWWLLHLPQCIRSPRIGCTVVGHEGNAVVDD